jgi:hypothetical protein
MGSPPIDGVFSSSPRTENANLSRNSLLREEPRSSVTLMLNVYGIKELVLHFFIPTRNGP